MLAATIAACEKMPELNDYNCQPEMIMTINDESMRIDFENQCKQRPNPRSGAYKKSEKKVW